MEKAQIARQLADAFERRIRDNSEGFYALRDGSPEWMQEAILQAHDGGEMLPNDWSYALAQAMAERIAEALQDDGSAELADVVDDASDALIPDDHAARCDWLASHLHRLAMADESVEEYGFPAEGGLLQAIAYGMQRELHLIGSALASAIEAEAAKVDA